MSSLTARNDEDRSALSLSASLSTDVMTDSARESLALRREIGQRVSAIALLMHLEGIAGPERDCFTEAFARSLIGGIVALYLDRFGPEPRDQAKQLLLSAADAISDSIKSGPMRGGKGGSL
jgi:hypothetical protein